MVQKERPSPEKRKEKKRKILRIRLHAFFSHFSIKFPAKLRVVSIVSPSRLDMATILLLCRYRQRRSFRWLGESND